VDNTVWSPAKREIEKEREIYLYYISKQIYFGTSVSASLAILFGIE